MSVFFMQGDCRHGHEPPLSVGTVARRWGAACVIGVGLVGSVAYGQRAMPEDDFIPLMNTPIMQQPVEQGAASLLPIQSPKPAARDAEWGGALLNSSAQTRNLCEAAVAQLASGQAKQAFDVLVPYWPLSNEELTRLVSQTQAQLAQLTASYGPIVGYEWVRSRDAGKSLVQHWYLVKMQYHALRIGCTFYKPVQTWQVHTVFWDDQIDALFGP